MLSLCYQYLDLDTLLAVGSVSRHWSIVQQLPSSWSTRVNDWESKRCFKPRTLRAIAEAPLRLRQLVTNISFEYTRFFLKTLDEGVEQQHETTPLSAAAPQPSTSSSSSSQWGASPLPPYLRLCSKLKSVQMDECENNSRGRVRPQPQRNERDGLALVEYAYENLMTAVGVKFAECARGKVFRLPMGKNRHKLQKLDLKSDSCASQKRTSISPPLHRLLLFSFLLPIPFSL